MHVLNIGSLNIDNVYQVPHFLRGGETVAAYRRTLHVGGKGLNQSVALARAGIASSHAGIIGRDGEVLKNFLEAEGVNVAHVEMRADEASGHTVIQISPEGENAILYYPGTNTCLTREFVKNAVSDLKQGDVLLLQNETNAIRDAIEICRSTAARRRSGTFTSPAGRRQRRWGESASTTLTGRTGRRKRPMASICRRDRRRISPS